MYGLTGEVRAAQIFVATLGASSYTYAEATWTQAPPQLDWLSRAFAYFGGVAAQWHLKSGVVGTINPAWRPAIRRANGPLVATRGALRPLRPRRALPTMNGWKT